MQMAWANEGKDEGRHYCARNTDLTRQTRVQASLQDCQSLSTNLVDISSRLVFQDEGEMQELIRNHSASDPHQMHIKASKAMRNRKAKPKGLVR